MVSIACLRSKYMCIDLLFLVICASQSMSRTLHESGELSMAEKHEQWMTDFGRAYKHSAEKEMRFQIFKANAEYIDSFNNNGNRSYTLHINRFADQTSQEFKASRNGYKMQSRSRKYRFMYENVTEVPSSMDWRMKGAVTPIKDQGECGSCWAFSAVAAVEGITQLRTGKLISLSEQQILDCDIKGDNQACAGGYMEDAFKFIHHNHGLTTESRYPYKGVNSTCNKQRKSRNVLAKIRGYEIVPPNNEKALLKAVANQPVAISIDASGFQFYSSGIFSGDCGTDLDHGVTAVGYGATSDGTKYWLVKNSWGIEWGEEGYIRIQRDIDAEEGLCGIAMDSSYPIA